MSNQIANDQQQSRLKELIKKGKEQGFLTYGEVNDHLPDDISDPEQIEDIIRMINDMGITVYETAPDANESVRAPRVLIRIYTDLRHSRNEKLWVIKLPMTSSNRA